MQYYVLLHFPCSSAQLGFQLLYEGFMLLIQYIYIYVCVCVCVCVCEGFMLNAHGPHLILMLLAAILHFP